MLSLGAVNHVTKIQPTPPTVWQCEGWFALQYEHLPRLVTAGMMMRSPTFRSVTAEPTSVMVPTARGRGCARAPPRGSRP